MLERRGKLPSNNIMREHKFMALHKEQEQMSNPNRDTQFAGWAKAVLDELVHTPNIDIDPLYDFKLEEWQLILARAAYDLVAHTLWHTAALDLERLSISENVARIPDLAELPEEQEG